MAYLASRQSHQSAEEIFAALRPRHPRLSVGTVYRNLHILVAQGKLRALRFGSGQDLYDARLDPHYHLLCDDCGDLRDFEMPILPGLEEGARHLAGDFQLLGHTLVFHGLCRTCSNARARRPAASGASTPRQGGTT
jgi:Fe2+ or Zn2+ uptake regulation protein